MNDTLKQFTGLESELSGLKNTQQWLTELESELPGQSGTHICKACLQKKL